MFLRKSPKNDYYVLKHYASLTKRKKSMVFLFLFLQGICFLPVVRGNEATVIIVRSQHIASYNEAIKGFEEGCKGKNIHIKEIYDLEGDINIEKGKGIIRNINNAAVKPDLILAVGVLASILMKEHCANVPMLFCMAINYERLNLQGPNVTGISSEVAIEDQFAVLRELLGKLKQRKIGVVYDPRNMGCIIAKAISVAKKFEFDLIAKEAFSDSEVVSALKNIIKKIDVLWIVPDETVITKDSLHAILQETQQHRIPTLCTSSAIVKAGALISVSPDYRYIGLQAARLAQALLRNPVGMSLGIQQPDKLKITLNTQIAKEIGINPSSIQYRPDIGLYP